MTTPNDIDNQLRNELKQSVATVSADSMTVERLIRNARSDAPGRRRTQTWAAPLLAAAAVIAIVVVTLAVTSAGKSGHKLPPVPPGSHGPSVSTSPSSPVGSINAHVLGPDGLGKLRLGMTRAQAVATGTIAEIEPYQSGGTCTLIHLTGVPVKPGTGDGYLSKSLGIVEIEAPAGVKTPEGIGAGSTLAQVRRAYPSSFGTGFNRQDNGPRVPVPGNPGAFYQMPIGTDNRVRFVMIALTNQDCFG